MVDKSCVVDLDVRVVGSGCEHGVAKGPTNGAGGYCRMGEPFK